MQAGPEVRILSQANPEGVFGVFEGLDKVGKTTLVHAVAARLEKDGKEFLAQREPGGTHMSEAVREILLKPWDEEITPETEIMLAMAYRRQNVVNNIIPAQAAGKIVLSDRFTLSTYALNTMPYVSDTPQSEPLYQLFLGLMQAATHGMVFEPITFMVVIPEELRQARHDAEPAPDRMENKYKDDAWRKRVTDVYKLYEKAPNTVVIDGTLPLFEQVELVLEHLESVRVAQRETVSKAQAKLAEFEAEVKRREEEAQAEVAKGEQVSDPDAKPSDNAVPAEPEVELTPEEMVDRLVVQMVVEDLYAPNERREERLAAGKLTARLMIEKTISLIGEQPFYHPHHLKDFINRFQSMEYYNAMHEDTQINLNKSNEQLQAEHEALHGKPADQEPELREATEAEVAEARSQVSE